MDEQTVIGRRIASCLAALPVAAALAVLPTAAPAQSLGKFVITPVVEKTVAELPDGELYWLVETFPSLADAEAAAGQTALAAEIDGKGWLFTLGSKGAETHGGTKVIEVGPVTRFDAAEYLLRVNSATAPPGAKTSIHTHPGSETFYVLTGQLTQQTPYGVNVVDAGQTMPGRGPGTAMEVSSTGDVDLNELIMFIVDAGEPFSSPASFD